jgi:peptide deformylase
MSHLKKFSERLIRHKLNPQVLQISTLRDLEDCKLDEAASSIVSITKKISDFLVPSLIQTAKFHGLVSLSCNNVNLTPAAFVIHKDLKAGIWTGYSGNDYQVFLNPRVLEVAEPITEEFEVCPSVPFVRAKVPRHCVVRAEYLTVDGEYREEMMEGFKARVFLHENDHLEGILISSFLVNLGMIECVDSEKYPEVDEVIGRYKRKLEEMIRILEDRYITDPEFKKKADKYDSKRDYFIETIADDDFEEEFHIDLINSLDISSKPE